MSERRVLLLNTSWQAIKTISWQRAIVLQCRGVVEVVNTYTGEFIRSPSMSFPIPSIVRCLKPFKFSFKEARFTRKNVYLRDNGKCRYCNTKIPFEDVTLDHVHPKSKGGGSGWDNIVISCGSCNQRKGSRPLHETGMKIHGDRPSKPVAMPNKGLFYPLGQNIPEDWVPFIAV